MPDERRRTAIRAAAKALDPFLADFVHRDTAAEEAAESAIAAFIRCLSQEFNPEHPEKGERAKAGQIWARRSMGSLGRYRVVAVRGDGAVVVVRLDNDNDPLPPFKPDYFYREFRRVSDKALAVAETGEREATDEEQAKDDAREAFSANIRHPDTLAEFGDPQHAHTPEECFTQGWNAAAEHFRDEAMAPYHAQAASERQRVPEPFPNEGGTDG